MAVEVSTKSLQKLIDYWSSIFFFFLGKKEFTLKWPTRPGVPSPQSNKNRKKKYEQAHRLNNCPNI